MARIEIVFKATTRFNPEHLGSKLRKSWISACGKYRITWRKQFMGVDVLPRYYALKLAVRCDGDTYWDFALCSERRPYKTFKRAQQACYKSAGIEIKETLLPKKRHRRSRGRDAIPLIAPTVVPTVTEKKVKMLPTALEVAQDLQPKKRGRPAGSKNKVKK
jgi:hypothetical protein